MILHAENWQIFMAHSFDRAVVQIDVCNFNLFRQRSRINREAVILGGDRHFARTQILYRLIRATMSEFQFEGIAAKGEAEHLMPEANTEHRLFRDQLANAFVGVGERFWITRTI